MTTPRRKWLQRNCQRIRSLQLEVPSAGFKYWCDHNYSFRTKYIHVDAAPPEQQQKQHQQQCDCEMEEADATNAAAAKDSSNEHDTGSPCKLSAGQYIGQLFSIMAGGALQQLSIAFELWDLYSKYQDRRPPDLPETLGLLTSLRELRLSGLTQQHLPSFLCTSLTRLTSLSVTDCSNLVTLPDSVGALTCLRSLTLVDNAAGRKVKLPESISALCLLQVSCTTSGAGHLVNSTAIAGQ
jgi:hypothetical protein